MSVPPPDAPEVDPLVHVFSYFSMSTCNLAGWNTIVEQPDTRGTGAKARLPCYTYAFKMFKHHHLSVVGVQEHHLHPDVEMAAAEYRAGVHGYMFVDWPSPDGSLEYVFYISPSGSISPPLLCLIAFFVSS